MAVDAQQSPTSEERQKRFPIVQIEMTDKFLKIGLMDDKTHLAVTVPDEMVEHWFTKWQELQNGTATERFVYGRWYGGEWNTEEFKAYLLDCMRNSPPNYTIKEEGK